MAEVNPFDKDRYNIQGPWPHQFAIAKSDSADLAVPSRGLWIQTGGVIKIVAWGDTDPVEYTVADKSFLGHVLVKRVHSTGTTASGFVGGY